MSFVHVDERLPGGTTAPVHHRNHEMGDERQEQCESQQGQNEQKKDDDRNPETCSRSSSSRKKAERDGHEKNNNGRQAHGPKGDDEGEQEKAVAFPPKFPPRLGDRGAILHHAIGENKTAAGRHPLKTKIEDKQNQPAHNDEGDRPCRHRPIRGQVPVTGRPVFPVS